MKFLSSPMRCIRTDRIDNRISNVIIREGLSEKSMIEITKGNKEKYEAQLERMGPERRRGGEETIRIYLEGQRKRTSCEYE